MEIEAGAETGGRRTEHSKGPLSSARDQMTARRHRIDDDEGDDDEENDDDEAKDNRKTNKKAPKTKQAK